MQRYVRIAGSFLAGATLICAAACSSRSGAYGGLLPGVDQAASRLAPMARSTPPVTAPVTIPYPYTNNWVTTTWSGPSSRGVRTPGSDTGVITVQFALNDKTGIYDVLERIDSKSGYIEKLDSAIGFLRHRGGIAQIILSDDYTFVEGPFSETGMDTYPNGQNSFDFPLTKGRHWNAAAAHTSSLNESQTGKGSFDENVATKEAADGTYRGQTSFSSLGHRKIEDNYASTTDVSLNRPSVYTLSERAAGYHKLTQDFELPHAGHIDVRSEGHNPLPVKRGTVRVPDWYPESGELPRALYSDRFTVVGAATMPVFCGSHQGEASTEVLEKFANLDPVQGFYNTYVSEYYLASLAPGQYWFACIVENYRNETFANGWAMSAGNWGALTSRQIGTEILIARNVHEGSHAMPPALASLPALTFPSLGFHARIGP
ncbi:MAG: hypothetical protein WB810_06980 [Candidatus Cybelea sp.]